MVVDRCIENDDVPALRPKTRIMFGWLTLAPTMRGHRFTVAGDSSGSEHCPNHVRVQRTISEKYCQSVRLLGVA